MFLHHYQGYTISTLMKEYAIRFYVLLDEAMIIDAEKQYDRLCASIFPNTGKQNIDSRLAKLAKIFNSDEISGTINVETDRKRLKAFVRKNKK